MMVSRYIGLWRLRINSDTFLVGKDQSVALLAKILPPVPRRGSALAGPKGEALERPVPEGLPSPEFCDLHDELITILHQMMAAPMLVFAAPYGRDRQPDPAAPAAEAKGQPDGRTARGEAEEAVAAVGRNDGDGSAPNPSTSPNFPQPHSEHGKRPKNAPGGSERGNKDGDRDCICSTEAEYRRAQELTQYPNLMEAHLRGGTLSYYRRVGPQRFEYQLADPAEHKRIKDLIEEEHAGKRASKPKKK
jgi:hypothetical protein